MVYGRPVTVQRHYFLSVTFSVTNTLRRLLTDRWDTQRAPIGLLDVLMGTSLVLQDSLLGTGDVPELSLDYSTNLIATQLSIISLVEMQSRKGL